MDEGAIPALTAEDLRCSAPHGVPRRFRARVVAVEPRHTRKGVPWKVGMDNYTIHDLRHFFASGLIAHGCDVVTVQHALGHSSPSITLDTYSHLWPKAEERTRTAAAGLISAALADAGRTAAAE